MAIPQNLTYEDLAKICPEDTRKIWSKICNLAGKGEVSPSHFGGLSLGDISADAKKQIEENLSPKKGDK